MCKSAPVDTTQGLSPRTRGNPPAGIALRGPLGSIPANAGEPRARCAAALRRWVYPRERGGTRLGAGDDHLCEGLSPRTRGNLEIASSAPLQFGSIPANAGEPPSTRRPSRPQRVYPRERGGTRSGAASPRPGTGLSPRTRGNRRAPAPAGRPPRSIPANAGEPAAPSSRARARRVYPRERGGTPEPWFANTSGSGLSPRTRGNLLGKPFASKPKGSIPANAGEPSTFPRWRTSTGVYPRERGGTCAADQAPHLAAGLSPRTRGNHKPIPLRGQRQGSIPANAGEPGSRASASGPRRVYPRERGGTRTTRAGRGFGAGLSPRTRGNPSAPATWAQ